LDVAVAEVEEAVVDDVGVTDSRQAQALEILAGEFEQADAKAGRPVVHFGAVAVYVPVQPDALIEATKLLARVAGSAVGPGAYVSQKGAANAEDWMKALKQLS
jgi:hypothetical protein